MHRENTKCKETERNKRLQIQYHDNIVYFNSDSNHFQTFLHKKIKSFSVRQQKNRTTKNSCNLRQVFGLAGQK